MVLGAALPSCGFVGPTAPLLSSMSISANPLAIDINGETSTITVTLIEGDGNPVADGTIVFLTTTLGQIPSEIRTTNGRSEATLVSGEVAGTARVSAASGTAGASVDVAVGSTEANLPPIAEFTFSPANPAVEQDVFFNGTGSADADGTIESYKWDFGDGSSAEGAQASHRFETAQTFTVALTVTDDGGAVGTTSSQVTVGQGGAPTASFTFAPSQPRVGLVITFDGSSSTDPDGDIVRYEWNWGDGTSPSVSADPTSQHVFSAAGTFSVTLTVTDSQGLTAAATTSVAVLQ